MIITIADYFDGEIAGKENQIIEAIRSGYQLCCIWESDLDQHESFLLKEYMEVGQRVLRGYFRYSCDDSDGRILEVREEIDRTGNGAIRIGEDGVQCTFIPDDVLQIALENAIQGSRRIVYNPIPWENNDEDFFVQWRFDHGDPTMMVLYKDEGDCGKAIEKWLLVWVKEHTGHNVIPEYYYYIKLENRAKLLSDNVEADIVNELCEKLPGLFCRTRDFNEYLQVLESNLGPDYWVRLTESYHGDRLLFDECWAESAIENALLR